MSSTPQDEFAAIDLGSNSFHMVVAREDAGQLRLLDRLREPVSLGAGLDADKRLTEDVQERALSCLSNFAQRLRALPQKNVRAVGTKTLRRATNAREFLRQAERVLGHKIDVIPGREEARLIYHGVRASGEMIGPAPYLVLDIGGASTEIAVGSEAQPDFTESISAGCVVATQKHFSGGRVTEARWRRAVSDVRIELRPLKRALQRSQWQSAIGCSGSIKAIANHLLRTGIGEGDTVTSDDLQGIRDTLIAGGSIDHSAFDGLPESRRRVFAGGCAVLTALFESLDIESLRVSQAALREGVLYELFGHTENDVQRHTVGSVQRRFGIDTDQANRVAETVTTLIDNLQGSWDITPHNRRLLQHAAHLHEIGLAISHSQFHKHGELLLNRTDLPGFTRREQSTLATLVRLQRRRFNAKLIPEALEADRVEVMRMALLLRIGLILCRDRQQTPTAPLDINARKREVTMSAPASWYGAHPLTHSELQRESDFADAAGLALVLRDS